MLSLAYSFIQSFYFSYLNLSDSFLNEKKTIKSITWAS